MINNKELTKEIGDIGYNILDSIISPVCKVDGILSNLYLTSIKNYVAEEELIKKIINDIRRTYDLSESATFMINEDTPIALIALLILENGK